MVTTTALLITRAIQTLDVVRDDLNDFTVRSVAGGVLSGLQATVNGNQATLRQVVRDVFRGLVPRGHVKEIRVRRTVLRLHSLLDGDGKADDALAPCGGPQLGIAGQTTNEDDSVNHGLILAKKDSVSDDFVVVPHLAVQLSRDFALRFEVHQDVVAFFVAINFVSQLSLVPLCGGFDVTAFLFHDGLVALGDVLDFLVGEARGHDIKRFVLSSIQNSNLLPLDWVSASSGSGDAESLSASGKDTPTNSGSQTSELKTMTLLVAATLLMAPSERLPDLSWNTYNSLRERVALSRDERTFFELPWRTAVDTNDLRPALVWSVRGSGVGLNVSEYGVASRQGFLSSPAAKELRDRVQWVVRVVNSRADEGIQLLGVGSEIARSVATDAAAVKRDLGAAYQFPAKKGLSVVTGRAVIRVISRDLRQPKGPYNVIELPIDPLAIGQLASRNDRDQLLARLLATRGLLDNPKGTALPFTTGEVLKATLNAGTPARGDYQLAGRVNCNATGDWSRDADANPNPESNQVRGIDVQLLGRMNFDAASSQVRRFEVVGIGTRWGAQPFNGRRGDTAPSDIGFLISLEPAWIRAEPSQIKPK